MELEWHEAKRLANLAKHRLDFIDASAVFEGPHVIDTARPSGEEQRFLAIGNCDGDLVAVVYTMRGERARIISMRRGRTNERLRYQAVHG